MIHVCTNMSNSSQREVFHQFVLISLTVCLSNEIQLCTKIYHKSYCSSKRMRNSRKMMCVQWNECWELTGAGSRGGRSCFIRSSVGHTPLDFWRRVFLAMIDSLRLMTQGVEVFDITITIAELCVQIAVQRIPGAESETAFQYLKKAEELTEPHSARWTANRGRLRVRVDVYHTMGMYYRRYARGVGATASSSGVLGSFCFVSFFSYSISVYNIVAE